MSSTSSVTQIAFIIEQALGHITHGQNLKKNVALDPTIEAHWGLPEQPKNWQGRIPIWRNWTLQAGMQANQALNRISQKADLDVIFFHTQVTAILAGKWLRKVPSVVSLDATPIQYDALGQFYQHDPGPSWQEKRKWEMNRRCYMAARHLVTWSTWAKESLINDYDVPGEKITVIPPGVNVSDWEPPQTHIKPEGAVRILFVGGNLERKGGHDLLNAYRLLRDETLDQQGQPTVELHLVTRDQVPSEPGLTVYNNMKPNSAPLKQLYFDSDIFCLPTYGDCLPMVLSEAGAAHLPTITTNVAAIPEIVHEAASGFIIQPGDVRSMKERLAALVQSREMRIDQGKTANKIVRETFDARDNAQRLLKLLKRVGQKDQEQVMAY